MNLGFWGMLSQSLSLKTACFVERRSSPSAIAVVVVIEYRYDYDHDNDNDHEPSLRPSRLTPASPDWDQRKIRYRSPAVGCEGASDARNATEEPAEKVVA